MKVLGIAMIILFSTLLGISQSRDKKDKSDICANLVRASDDLLINLNYFNDDSTLLFKRLIDDETIHNIDFFTHYDFSEKEKIKTTLSQSENERINLFLSSFGTTDINSQLKMTEGFKAFFERRRDIYKQDYEKNRKLYAAGGLSLGIVVSIMLI